MQKRPPKRKNLVFQWRRVKKRTEDRLNEGFFVNLSFVTIVFCHHKM